MTKKVKPPILAPHDIRELRGKIHHLKPIIIIGNNGLIPAVIQEIDRALNDHELIKIRVHVKDSKEELTKITQEICTKTNATTIQTIGHIIAIYRKNLQSDVGENN
ncbi:MAG: ribosome assembly RNA-binding protein YhbY [bacterium]